MAIRVFIAENQTGTEIVLDDIGVSVPASGSTTLTETLFVFEIQESVDLFTQVQSGNILINDGSVTLNQQESEDSLKPPGDEQINTNKDNIEDLQLNALFKPAIASNNEFDILSQSSTPGDFNYRTPNNGVVKIIGILNGVILNGNGIVAIDLQGSASEVFTSSTSFPKNYSNDFPGQDPVNNKATFLPGIYNSADDRWLENSVEFQVHLWRVSISYTRNSTQSNRELIVRVNNPDTGFSLQEVKILPNGTQFQSTTLTWNFSTVADSSSIGSGYEFEIQAVNAPLTINTVEIVRTSLETL